ncbi:efflux RND transporter periplasmic adaptor subunit [Selenomonas sp.]|uniref:efflux RND transporter periplasmic adaptor subunit n=1 Tax=Selenomonas sp. TaxID=2053611 RepID=UPI003FA31895
MKRILLIGLALTMSLVIGLMIYGTYLNHFGENKIARQLEDRRITLTGARATVRMLHPILRFDTMTLQSPDMADTVSLIDGRIASITVKRNDDVEAGEVVCRLVNGEYPLKIQEMDSNIMEAEAKLQQAKNDYERYQRLWNQEAASKEKLEAMYTTYQALITRVAALEAQKQQLLLQESYQQVTAPISGKVLLVYQAAGAFVKAGTPLVLVGNNGALRFSKTVKDYLARWYPVGQKVGVSILLEDFQKAYDTSYGVGNRGEKQDFTATVVSVEPPLTEPAEMRRVVWSVDNSSGILDMKTYKNVELRSFQEHRALTVPLAAVENPLSEHPLVYVWNERQEIEMREVSVGVQDKEYIEILAGVSEGDVVITSGKEGLESGTKAAVQLEEGA